MNFSNSLAQPCCFGCTFGSERVKNWLWNIATCNEKIAMVVFYSLLNAMLDSVTFNNWPSHLQIFDVCKGGL